jgi:hypothetical protein
MTRPARSEFLYAAPADAKPASSSSDSAHTLYYNRFNFKIVPKSSSSSSSSSYNFLIRLQSRISVNFLQLDATPKWHFCEEPPAALSENQALKRVFCIRDSRTVTELKVKQKY